MCEANLGLPRDSDEVGREVGRAMKRFLIFILLGPLLGYLVFVLRNASAGKIVGGFMGFVFGVPIAYLFGLPIVLIMWVEDWFLFDKIGLGIKLATSACVGYLASIAMLLLTSALHLHLPEILTFGIVGAIPAAVCSWLAALLNRDRRLHAPQSH
jgi:hypothetical protein